MSRHDHGLDDGAGLGVARAALRDAVAEMERTREPADSTTSRRALADARWSIIDHHEEDGRRYLVAVAPKPAVTGPEVLTGRERQVLVAATTGQSNKVIAYDLGVSDSTVRVLIARSAKKLGVKKRTEAIARYLAFVANATAAANGK